MGLTGLVDQGAGVHLFAIKGDTDSVLDYRRRARRSLSKHELGAKCSETEQQLSRLHLCVFLTRQDRS